MCFGFFNQLLIRRSGLSSHYNMTLLRINFRIKFSLTNQVNNPPFSFRGFHIEFLSQHFNGDTLVNTTESFENHKPGIFDEVLETSDQEKVGTEDSLTFSQFLLGTIKVEFHIQIFNK